MPGQVDRSTSDREQVYTLDRVVRLVVTALVAAAAFALLRYLADVLVPFAVAAVLAYLLNPIVDRLALRVKRRWLAVACTLAGLLLLAGLSMLTLVPVIVGQVYRFERSLSGLHVDLPGPTGLEVSAGDQPPPTSQSDTSGKSYLGLSELRDGWAEFRGNAGTATREERFRTLLRRIEGTQAGDLVEQAVAFVQTQQFRELLVSAAKRLVGGGLAVVNFAFDAVVGATVAIVVLTYLFFLLLEYDEYARTWPTLLPAKHREGILAFLREFEDVLRRYFRGQVIVSIAVGLLSMIGFSIIGLPMAVLLGLFVGLLNMVPYLQIVALAPAALLAVLRSFETDGSLLGSMALVLLVFAVVQVLQDAVIVPRVMGRATGLRPVAIMLGVFVWGKLLGFFGLVLAIPLTCLGITYYRRLVLKHRTEAPEPEYAV